MDDHKVDIDEDVEPQPEELEAPEIRTEQERRSAAERQVSDQTNSMVKESKEYAINSLTSLSLTELERLRDDEEYRDDSTMTSNHYVRMCKTKDNMEDQALKTATENIKMAEDLEGDQQIY